MAVQITTKRYIDRLLSATPPDGALPVGTKPTNENVGLPGVGNPTMTSEVSSSFLSTNDAVYEDVHFTYAGGITIPGNDVTFRRCKFDGNPVFRGDGMVMEDCDVPAMTLGGQNFTVRRVRTTGRAGTDGIGVTSDVYQVETGLIEYCYVGNGLLSAESHYDNIQVRGAIDLTIQYNNFDVLADAVETNEESPRFGEPVFDTRSNASIFLENANGGNTDILVYHNWSRVNGYYHFRPYGTNIEFIDNICIPLGDPDASEPTPFIGNRTGTTGSGNQWLDGTPITV